MKILKKHTTSKGNELEFYQLDEYAMVVIDNSCVMSRVYELGYTGILCWDDYDKPLEEITEIQSFYQVIDAWVNEEIHF